MRRAFGLAMSLAVIPALTSGSALAAAAGGAQPAAPPMATGMARRVSQ